MLEEAVSRIDVALRQFIDSDAATLDKLGELIRTHRNGFDKLIFEYEGGQAATQVRERKYVWLGIGLMMSAEIQRCRAHAATRARTESESLQN
jgi:hypothetical protein